MKYKTIKDVHEACKNGDVDESDLEIIVDNDNTGFYLTSNSHLIVDEDGDDERQYDMICEGRGDYDIMELYQLLFPKAMVDRC